MSELYLACSVAECGCDAGCRLLTERGLCHRKATQVAALEHDKTAAEEQTTRANAKMTRAAAVRMEMKVRHSRNLSDILAHLHT